MKVLDAVMNLLATKRLVRLVLDDVILDDVRNPILDRFPPKTHKLGYLLTCVACSSFWLAVPAASGLLPRAVRDTLALSEATIIASQLLPSD